MKKNDYLERILSRARLRCRDRDAARASPRIFPRGCDNRLFLKREDLQPVFSFKLRGAYNKMAQLPAAALRRGVIAASAGNHAQGVALAAQKLRCSATIVMPVTTPQIKVAAVKARGAKVVLHGDSYDEAYEHATVLGRRQRLTFVHPYDDPDVIAGQGTMAMEILRQHAAADTRHLRADRRRRADLRHRGLREAAAPGDQDDRRRARGRGCDVSLAQGGPAREARPGRPVRRRRRGEAGRGGDVPPVPRRSSTR